jgi:hypothetical protein
VEAIISRIIWSHGTDSYNHGSPEHRLCAVTPDQKTNAVHIDKLDPFVNLNLVDTSEQISHDLANSSAILRHVETDMNCMETNMSNNSPSPTAFQRNAHDDDSNRESTTAQTQETEVTIKDIPGNGVCLINYKGNKGITTHYRSRRNSLLQPFGRTKKKESFPNEWIQREIIDYITNFYQLKEMRFFKEFNGKFAELRGAHMFEAIRTDFTNYKGESNKHIKDKSDKSVNSRGKNSTLKDATGSTRRASKSSSMKCISTLFESKRIELETLCLDEGKKVIYQGIMDRVHDASLRGILDDSVVASEELYDWGKNTWEYFFEQGIPKKQTTNSKWLTLAALMKSKRKSLYEQDANPCKRMIFEGILNDVGYAAVDNKITNDTKEDLRVWVESTWIYFFAKGRSKKRRFSDVLHDDQNTESDSKIASDGSRKRMHDGESSSVASTRCKTTGVPLEIDLSGNYCGESYYCDDDEQASSTCNNSHRTSRHECGSSVSSKAASTIASGNKSVKRVQLDVELGTDDRSFANSISGNAGASCQSIVKGLKSVMSETDERSTCFSDSKNMQCNKAAMATENRSDRDECQGDAETSQRNSKKPARRRSFSSSGHRRKMSSGSQNNQISGDAGTYEVEAMIVTDPYGEKGLYTGSISSSTGMPNGYGRLEYDKAMRWYEGDWEHGRWTGRGQLSNGDGDFYEGELKNDHKHGFGKMKFADGRMYEGEYISGQMIEGKMTYQDGSTYRGSWVYGMRHGRGRCVFTDESIYEGEFKEGEFFGHGKMSWNDGGWYEGSWLNGDMHGHGREVRADGALRHDGEWLKGQPLRTKKSNME